MLVECGRCGAPLAVKRKARRTKCRYCGAVDERERMKAIAHETPQDFVPPKVWTPPADREVEAKPLAYNAPLSPWLAWGGAVAMVAVVIGAPIAWESKRWNTRPEVLERSSPLGSHADVAKRLGGKVDSPTQILVPLNSERYETVVIRYANATDEVPTRFSIDQRHGTHADEAARDLLSSRLNGGLENGNWSWGDVHLAWFNSGMSAEIGHDSPAPLRQRRAVAAWTLLMGAAFNPALPPPSHDEMRDTMGGGYPVSTLSKISPSLPLEQVKAKVAATFPGALIEAKLQMNATVPLDHPLVRSVVLAWFVEPRGTLRDVSFQSKTALHGAAVDSLARCLAPALGPPRETIVNPIEGTRSYTFHPGNAQVDLNPTLSVTAYGAHGVPATVDEDTWKKLVTALDHCRG
jgi:hypothetical protein